MFKILFVDKFDKDGRGLHACSAAVYKELAESDNQVLYADLPTDVTDEEFIAAILPMIKDFSPEYIMTINYYPRLSLICGATQKKYISWIIDGNDLELCDPGIRNDWNRLFITDKAALNRLERKGVKNIEYLPLAPTIPIKTISDNGIDYTNNKRVLFWADGIRAEKSVSGIMNMLKDSSKGYLDACVECRKSDLVLKPLYEYLPDYVRDDITGNYPIEHTDPSDEAYKYDCMYFYPHIDESLAIKCLREISNIVTAEEICIASDVEILLEGNKLTKKTYMEAVNDNYKHAGEYGFNVCISNYMNGTTFTQDMWNIIASGGFIFVPDYLDDVLSDLSARVKFRHARKLVTKIIYYIEHEKEYIDLRQEINDRVHNIGGYDSRISTLISKL